MRNWSPITQGKVRPVKARSDRVSLNNRIVGSGRAHKVLLPLVMAGLALVCSPRAVARPPVPAPVFKAVRAYWRAPADRVKAFDVISCETGGRYNTTAANGQYLGLFQMGAWARARYGHGSSAMAQARAAHRYFVVAGWNPWECA